MHSHVYSSITHKSQNKEATKAPMNRWLDKDEVVCVYKSTAESLQSCPTLCDPIDGSPPGSPVPGILQARTLSGLPFPSSVHESEKWKWSRSVVPDSYPPHRLQPTRLPRPWDFPGKSTRVGCHCLYYSAIKKKDEILPLAITWMMNLEGYCANWSKSEEDKCCIFSLIVKPKNKGMNKAIQKKTQRRN